ncbi:hypothetical protein FV225_28330 [Methylobacterium sp. WL93]|nr:hypothetical protein FV225_28330 [Methylobacterium sp. WL93]
MTELLPSERTAQTLKRIATALGCTVRELLTLWDAIRRRTSRDRLAGAGIVVRKIQHAGSRATRSRGVG